MFEPRHYQPKRWSITLRTLEAVYGAGFVGIGVGTSLEDGAIAWPAVVLGTLLLLIMVTFAERVSIDTGLIESPTDYLDCGNYSRRTIARDAVSRFEARRVGRWLRVFVVMTDGTELRLRGIFQGRCVVWASGETRDITAVLNARLEEAAR